MFSLVLSVRQKSLPFEDSDQQLLRLLPKVKQASLLGRFLVRYQHENGYLMMETKVKLVVFPLCSYKSLSVVQMTLRLLS